ncbi:hypothetical protein Rhopal_007555-T1 [Rhodotorula paludigena]|uniref:Uncharacterized protein n=1 Tax=Rhodotorula paludigena TaxID=86838 RepID=A0AAV5GPG7_9BASI|nr:hypothetical protein Rhopal_007555-T1 [Rhodotorula paludigena]
MSSEVHPPADADEQIAQLLQRSAELDATLPPIYTWDELCDIIAAVRLERLDRHPALEAFYRGEFMTLIRKLYGTSEAYLRKQLGWPRPDPREEGRKAYWEREDVTVVRRNDLPYGVPKDVIHYVVWVNLPLFHPHLCTPAASALSTPLASSSGTATPSGPSHANPLAQPTSASTLASKLVDGGAGAKGRRQRVAPTKGTWDHVSENGLGGLTGEAERRFANPPYLQSVPGLAHFHVMARKVPLEEKA